MKSIFLVGLWVALLLLNFAAQAVDLVPSQIFVNGSSGSDEAAGDQPHPLRSLSAAIARLPDPLSQSVTIEWTAGEERSTGARGMSSDRLELMRRMRPGVQVSIIGRTNSAGTLPAMAWEGGTAMVDAREGNWALENIRIGTGSKRQRRGVLATGPAVVALNNIRFRTCSFSDAAIYAQRGGLIELRGMIQANEQLHRAAGDETFAGIVAMDHGIVRFTEREGASLDLGNGSLSVGDYGIIELGCESAHITSWGDQSNCLAVNNSGRIDLHNTTTYLTAAKKQNTPIGLEHDGHVLAEGARIIIEGTNDVAIYLQKASTLTGNDIELRGNFASTLTASSGSMFVGRFKTGVTGLAASTSASINVEAVDGKIIGPLTTNSGGLISLPDGRVLSGR